MHWTFVFSYGFLMKIIEIVCFPMVFLRDALTVNVLKWFSFEMHWKCVCVCIPMVFLWNALKLIVFLWFAYENHWNSMFSYGVLTKCIESVCSNGFLVKCIENYCCPMVFLWNALNIYGFLLFSCEMHCNLLLTNGFLWKSLKSYVFLWFSYVTHPWFS